MHMYVVIHVVVALWSYILQCVSLGHIPVRVYMYNIYVCDCKLDRGNEGDFLCPGLKVPPGASSNRIVRLFVRPFVRPSVCP